MMKMFLNVSPSPASNSFISIHFKQFRRISAEHLCGIQTRIARVEVEHAYH